MTDIHLCKTLCLNSIPLSQLSSLLLTFIHPLPNTHKHTHTQRHTAQVFPGHNILTFYFSCPCADQKSPMLCQRPVEANNPHLWGLSDVRSIKVSDFFHFSPWGLQPWTLLENNVGLSAWRWPVLVLEARDPHQTVRHTRTGPGWFRPDKVMPEIRQKSVLLS